MNLINSPAIILQATNRREFTWEGMAMTAVFLAIVLLFSIGVCEIHRRYKRW